MTSTIMHTHPSSSSSQNHQNPPPPFPFFFDTSSFEAAKAQSHHQHLSSSSQFLNPPTNTRNNAYNVEPTSMNQFNYSTRGVYQPPQLYHSSANYPTLQNQGPEGKQQSLYTSDNLQTSQYPQYSHPIPYNQQYNQHYQQTHPSYQNYPYPQQSYSQNNNNYSQVNPESYQNHYQANAFSQSMPHGAPMSFQHYPSSMNPNGFNSSSQSGYMNAPRLQQSSHGDQSSRTLNQTSWSFFSNSEHDEQPDTVSVADFVQNAIDIFSTSDSLESLGEYLSEYCSRHKESRGNRQIYSILREIGWNSEKRSWDFADNHSHVNAMPNSVQTIYKSQKDKYVTTIWEKLCQWHHFFNSQPKSFRPSSPKSKSDEGSYWKHPSTDQSIQTTMNNVESHQSHQINWIKDGTSINRRSRTQLEIPPDDDNDQSQAKLVKSTHDTKSNYQGYNNPNIYQDQYGNQYPSAYNHTNQNSSLNSGQSYNPQSYNPQQSYKQDQQSFNQQQPYNQQLNQQYQSSQSNHLTDDSYRITIDDEHPMDVSAIVNNYHNKTTTPKAPSLQSPPPEYTCPQFVQYNIGNTEFIVTTRYEIKGLMGQGAYGVVAHGVDLETGRAVAIKKMHLQHFNGNREYYRRILREIKIMQHVVDHENLLSLIDLIPPISEANFDAVYVVTLKMDTNLKQIITSDQELNEEHIDYFMYQILAAIRYLHVCTILHRDLKPENILLNSNCDLRVCDFGLSKGIPPIIQHPQNSTGGNIVSLHYRAPELILGFNHATPALDMWSVGAIMGELYTRKPLFRGNSIYETLDRILELIGTPDWKDVKGSNEGIQYLKKKRIFPRANFRQVFRNASDDAIDLLERLLQFNPEKRITAEEAMHHPFFSSYDFETLNQPIKNFDSHFDSSFEKEFSNLTAEKGKRLLFEEIIKYNFLHNRLICSNSLVQNREFIGNNFDSDFDDVHT